MTLPHRVPKTLSILGAALFLVLAVGCSNAGSEAPTKRALLIGIEDYSAPGLRKLEGPRNDVGLIGALLIDRFGFKPGNILQLVDSQATRAQIEAEFGRLEAATTAGDTLFIYYAGHGSRVRDANGDEGPGGQDSTLVPFDGREEKSREILDDEIELWLQKLLARSANVVLIVDACHSGTITRGVDSLSSRGATVRDERDYSWSESLLTALPAAKNAVKTSDRLVRISASLDHQEAREYRGPDGRVYGLFTWHLAKALRAAAPGDTYERVFGSVEAALYGIRGAFQTPFFEGPRTKSLFGGAFEPRSPEIYFASVVSGRARLRGGALEGVTVGSVYQRAGLPTVEQQKPARLRITEVGAFESFAEWLVTGSSEPGQPYVEVEHAPGLSKLSVAIAVRDTGAARHVKMIRDALEPLTGIELTESIRAADLVLELRHAATDSATVVCRFLDGGGEIYGGHYFSPDLLEIRSNGLAVDADRIAHNVETLARIRRFDVVAESTQAALPAVQVELLVRSPARGGEPAATVDMIETEDSNAASKPFLKPVTVDVPFGTATVASGSIISFKATNHSAQQLYLYLINRTPAGEIKVFIPSSSSSPEDSVKLMPGESRVFDGQKVRLVDPPPLVDSYIWLITDRPADPWVLKGGGGLRRSQTQPSGLNAVLEEVHGASTRSGSTTRSTIRPGEVATRRFDIRLTEAHH